MLGTNDSKKKHWIHKDRFEKDLNTFISDFRQINPAGKIFICLPPPAFDGSGNLSNGDSISGKRIQKEIIPIIQKVARKEKIQTIPVFSAMRNHPEFFSDGVHPNEEGAAFLAQIIQQKIQ
jgi:lysophospholipase L1-like esterase